MHCLLYFRTWKNHSFGCCFPLPGHLQIGYFEMQQTLNDTKRAFLLYRPQRQSDDESRDGPLQA